MGFKNRAKTGIKVCEDLILADGSKSTAHLCSGNLKTKGACIICFLIKVKSRPCFSGRNAKPGVLFKKSDPDVCRIWALVPDQHTGDHSISKAVHPSKESKESVSRLPYQREEREECRPGRCEPASACRLPWGASVLWKPADRFVTLPPWQRTDTHTQFPLCVCLRVYGHHDVPRWSSKCVRHNLKSQVSATWWAD